MKINERLSLKPLAMPGTQHEKGAQHGRCRPTEPGRLLAVAVLGRESLKVPP